MGHALFLGGDDVEGHDRQHGPVHGHGDRHLVQRDAVEEGLHVAQGTDGHAGLAHVADDARVVAVVAAVGGQVEGHRQTALPAGQVASVEGVALLGRAEAGVLAHRPGVGDVHCGIGAAQEGRQPGHVVNVGQGDRVVGGVERPDVDLLHRAPEEVGRGLAGLGFQRGLPLGQGVGRVGGLEFELGEVRV